MVAPTSLLAVLQWRLPHGVPERVDCRFGFPHRHIHSVTQLMALLHQASHRLARRPDPAMYCYWKHRAAVEMRPDTVGQVRVAPRAPVCPDAERINRGHLSQIESSSAANALGDLVVPTVDEEECAFLGAQNTRPTTIEMTENPEAEDDGSGGWCDACDQLLEPTQLVMSIPWPSEKTFARTASCSGNARGDGAPPMRPRVQAQLFCSP